MGVKRGDRVAAYIPNIPETIVTFLACAAIGATWSSCSPDFETRSVIDRFKQIEPKVLFAVDGYQYGGKRFDCRTAISALQQSLLSLENIVLIPYLQMDAGPGETGGVLMWDDLLIEGGELLFEQVPFDHPLWVVYSSDSTINRFGVRMGSSEIYAAVEELAEVADSLVIGFETPAGQYVMPLFVVLEEGLELDDSLKKSINDKIRTALSPRHVPDEIYAIPQVPRTLNAKKLEVPVKKILSGAPVEKAVNIDSMGNPEAIDYFVRLAHELNKKG
jgi:acyl-coenzyme A synthetase/AMP-(fatty) acid ligase